jgi:hypothetical protein
MTMNDFVLCGAFLPSDMSITCRLKMGNHPEHLGGFAPRVLLWPNETYIPPSTGDTMDIFRRAVARIPSLRHYEEVSPYFIEP